MHPKISTQFTVAIATACQNKWIIYATDYYQGDINGDFCPKKLAMHVEYCLHVLDVEVTNRFVMHIAIS